jgi:hypothetical protein
MVLSKTSTDLVAASGALGFLHKEMIPAADVPSSVEDLAGAFGAGTTAVMDFARGCTVRGSEYTLKLLLGNGVEVDFERSLSEYPKRSNGKPLSFKDVTDTATRLSEVCIQTMERHAEVIRTQSRKTKTESASRA